MVILAAASSTSSAFEISVDSSAACLIRCPGQTARSIVWLAELLSVSSTAAALLEYTPRYEENATITADRLLKSENQSLNVD